MTQNRESFKNCTKARLKTVKILINAEDWEGAAYMMGYVLEFSLKALICKKLDLSEYPDKKDSVTNFFMTHMFDRLRILAGLSRIISPLGNQDQYQNWSDFTSEYQGEWTAMRYEPGVKWDVTKIKALYNNLTDTKNGILTIIKKKW